MALGVDAVGMSANPHGNRTVDAPTGPSQMSPPLLILQRALQSTIPTVAMVGMSSAEQAHHHPSLPVLTRWRAMQKQLIAHICIAMPQTCILSPRGVMGPVSLAIYAQQDPATMVPQAWG